MSPTRPGPGPYRRLHVVRDEDLSPDSVGFRTPLRLVAGGAATKLAKSWNVHTVGDLLETYPRAYLDPARTTDFRSIKIGEPVVLVARVATAATRTMRSRRGKMLVVHLEDEGGRRLEVVFFRAFGHADRLLPDRYVIATGTVNERRQLTHPDYEILEDGGDKDGDGDGVGPNGSADGAWQRRLIPVYREAKGMTSMMIARVVDLVLHALTEVPDPIPAEVRAQRRLPNLMETYRLIHQPSGEADYRRGRWRLKWQEAFVIQAALAQRRRSANAVPAIARTGEHGSAVASFTAALPFELTDGQVQVIADLRADLASTIPMNRLLQGEVGSGKTIVALLAMLAVVDSGGQSALLAPTEVLAAQHFRSISTMLGPLGEGGLLGGAEGGTRVALLTGSQSAAERRRNLLLAASGEAGIVVGTHALIQDHVQFADLGLVVVDEQHRFGVKQRDALRAKAGSAIRQAQGDPATSEDAPDEGEVAPHVLVMTATPIPRTVAMTVYGDMTTSVLTELPRGRQPIATHVVSGAMPRWIERTWERVAEEVAAGGQVYVVCPRIGDPDDPDLPQGARVGPGLPMADPERPADLDNPADGDDLADVIDEDDSTEASPTLHGVHQVLRALRALPATAGLRVAAVHGKVPPEEKDATMRAFAAGVVDVLVATTVIEVGVDVPNATQMVILDADRFGVSQLHQLRGRVGRGGKPGLCLLMTQAEPDEAPERLNAVASTTDGFELARLDLELRREGDVLGAAQSGGRSSLRLLRLTRDEDLIVEAHDAAWQTIAADPDLHRAPELAAWLARIDAERAAFLERG